ncbi:MAG TPA: protein kinase [Pyrinomonadaceae bacterium]|nr:protein kinase [Pyrinomonadaceae bacterium]
MIHLSNMSSDTWQKTKEVFHAALELPSSERERFLDETCGDDVALRQEVDGLLSAHQKSGGFIDTPAYEVAADFLADHAELSTGQTVGPYRVISRLGKGGMGEVYLAHDERLDRKVALKLLPKYLVREMDLLQRFEREAKTASALNHPNIVTIHEIGRVDSLNYIIMEHVDGESLRDRLRPQKLQLNTAIDIGIQIATALSAAHEAGIIHRDIKTDNVMLRHDGLVKVLDFGLAKLAAADRSASSASSLRTNTGMVMGTTAYMSPEQVRGLPLDARTDIWSFGVVLYEMTTGRLPFEAVTNADVIARIIEHQPVIESDLPAGMQRVLEKCLAKDRDQRYQSATDVLEDLKDAKRELESVPALLSRNAGYKKAGLIALLLVVLVAASFAIYKRFGPKDSRALALLVPPPPTVIKTTQVTSSAGLDAFPALSPDGSMVAFSSSRTGKFEIYVSQLAPGGREVQITSDGKQNLQPAWSPDGKMIAYCSGERGGIWLTPALGGVPKQLTEFGSRPAWSPDGSTIAFQSEPMSSMEANSRAMPPSVLWLVSSRGGEARPLTKGGNPPGGHGAPSWSFDGKRIAFTAGGYISAELTIWSMAANGSDFKKLVVGAFDPLFSPDGDRIYFAKDSGVWSMALSKDSGEPLGDPVQLVPATGNGRMRSLTISADGKKLAFNPLISNSNIWSVRLSESNQGAGPPVQLTQNRNFRTGLPNFSPDGREIAYASWPTGARLPDIWVMDPNGKNPTQLTAGGSGPPSWLDNGQVLFLRRRQDHTDLMLIPRNGGSEKVLFDFNDKVEFARASPDGKTVAFNSGKGGTTNIWTISIEGKEAKQLTFDAELMAFPVWSPDGRYLAFQMRRGDDVNVAFIPGSGGTPTQLTFDKGTSYAHSWAPDNDKIVFAGLRNGFWNVWWVSRSTKREQQLTNNATFNSFVRYPAWSPRGDQIVYEYSETTGNVWVMELK